MFADNYCARLFAPKLSEDLRGLAIESLAKLNVVRNWLRPPIAFDVSIFSNVAHICGAIRLGCASGSASGSHDADNPVCTPILAGRIACVTSEIFPSCKVSRKCRRARSVPDHGLLQRSVHGR